MPVPDRHIIVDARMANGGGIGTYLRNLLPHVASLRPQWQFTLLVDGDSRQPSWIGESNIAARTCGAPIYSLREQWALRAACAVDADLFWSPHYNIPLSVPRRMRLAVTVHDIMHLTRPEYRVSVAKRVYTRVMFGAVRRHAALILFDSVFSARRFRQHVGPPVGITQVAELGVSDDWRAARSTQLARLCERPYVIFVGYQKPHKNLSGLLKAFGAIADKVPHDLVIVGRAGGLATPDLQVTRGAAALGDRVVFTGEVSDTELRAWVAHADLLVQPSFDEGFGLPPLEAMAIGCPCVVSNAGSLPEVCGDAAAYCDPYNPASIAEGIISVLGDDSYREQLVERGYARSQQFSWSRCADVTVGALEAALQARTG